MNDWIVFDSVLCVIDVLRFTTTLRACVDVLENSSMSEFALQTRTNHVEPREIVLRIEYTFFYRRHS